MNGLNGTWDMIADALARWTPPDLEQIFSAPDALSDEEKRAFGETTRQWMIWHVHEHEIHHGGQISLVLGGILVAKAGTETVKRIHQELGGKSANILFPDSVDNL